jgi:hypothetical protein
MKNVAQLNTCKEFGSFPNSQAMPVYPIVELKVIMSFAFSEFQLPSECRIKTFKSNNRVSLDWECKFLLLRLIIESIANKSKLKNRKKNNKKHFYKLKKMTKVRNKKKYFFTFLARSYILSRNWKTETVMIKNMSRNLKKWLRYETKNIFFLHFQLCRTF